MADIERPTKRRRTNDSNFKSENAGRQLTSSNSAITDIDPVRASGKSRQDRKYPKHQNTPIPKKDNKSAHRNTKAQLPRTFTQPSVICTGDKGIFVTSDKGREKKCLLELHDLVLGHLETTGFNANGNPVENGLPKQEQKALAYSTSASQSIEADIASELQDLRGGDSTSEDNGVSVKPLQLITLDIPCVSFLRFPPDSILDPVDLVHKICLDAADPSSPQRSRFIKRLTPLTKLGKALGQGLERACDEVLPPYFGSGSNGKTSSKRFAVRPTIRNNEKLNRDEVIQMVADRVQECGGGTHKVDLKTYEKGVIVEVYRGWVGICVVDNTATGAYKQGFESLRKFNLAEIYANR